MTRRAVALFVALALGGLVVIPPAVGATRVPAERSGVPAFRHVFIVVMENLDYSSALSTPGLAALADRYALATNYFAVSHPSLPNYLALTSGGTWGIESDCVDCYVSAPNLFSQLAKAHQSFAGYFEGIPNPCYLDPYGGVDYAGKHNPFRYYDDVRDSPSLCAHIEPYPRLITLLRDSEQAVPRFVWVTPNLCDDGHDCPATTAASWLTKFVATVTASAAWKDDGVLFVTWDEADGDDTAVNSAGDVVASGGGGHIMTLVIAPNLPAGKRVGIAYNHYSMLATIEDGLGLALLGGAKTARPLVAFFSQRAPVQRTKAG